MRQSPGSTGKNVPGHWMPAIANRRTDPNGSGRLYVVDDKPLNVSRRLQVSGAWVVRYERRAEHYLVFVHLGCVVILLRYL